jgi:hypothetical protein
VTKERETSAEVVRLLAAWDDFIIPLRMRDGVDAGAYARLTGALRECAEAWRHRDELPRQAVNVLVDVVPTMDGFAAAYGPEHADSLRTLAFELQELVGQCVAVAPDQPAGRAHGENLAPGASFNG